MAKRKLSVFTPWGTFTRATNRPYTHLVVSCGIEQATLQAQQMSELRQAHKELAEYRQVVAGERAPVCDLEHYPGFIANLERGLLAMPEKHEQQLHENRLAVIERRGELVGWSMSARNAQKMAAAATARGARFVNVYDVPQAEEQPALGGAALHAVQAQPVVTAAEYAAGAAPQAAERHLYAPIYRPAAFSGIPKGWEYVEAPRDVAHRLTHLPMSSRTHGVIAYDRQLTAEEVKRHELEYLGAR